MLQTLREKLSGLFAKIILGVLILAFSFFGIESYFITRTDTYVAKVGDREISQDDFRARFDQYRQQMVRMMGSSSIFDSSYFEKPEVKRQVLDQMIDEEVLLEANEKLGIAVTDESIREEIVKVPEFQTDGKFDLEQYKMLLAGQRMSGAEFEQRVRRDIAARELPAQVNATNIVTNAEVDAYLRLRDQLRDFRFVKLEKPEAKNTKVGDDEIDTYYKEHGQEFMWPEQIALEYLELDAAKLKVDVAPDDATLKALYEKGKSRFVSEEQRLASHILIKVDGKGEPEEQKKALSKAEALAKDAKSAKDFAQLAKQSSDDLGSKAQGGDLGWLEKGMADATFEAALFTLKKGEISDPILSAEGYHVINLRDIRSGSTRSFEEVKAELAKEHVDSERERLYSERAGRLTDLTYQDPTSLESAAKELGLTIEKTELFARQGGQGIAANPKVSKAAFSDTVLVQNGNSDPIELNPNHIVVVRVAEHKAAIPKPLDEVRAQIQGKITAKQLADQAKAGADELLMKLQKGNALDQIAKELKLTVNEQTGIGRTAANLDNALVQAVFDMPRPEQNKPEVKLVNLGNDAYALVQLNKVIDPDLTKLDAKTKEAAKTTLTQNLSNEASRGFIEALRKNTTIKVVEERM